MEADSVLEQGATGCIVVLAGPRVVDDGAVEALRALAAAGDLGVANTWGAKGVFAWDSPHHLGTCGLQSRDFELLGWAEADLIVTTGLTDEVMPGAYALAPVVDVATASLPALEGRLRATRAPVNALYPRLAGVAQPGYADTKVPLHPARATSDLGAALPPGGLVAADPGTSGLWVARTFPTPALTPGEARRVVVPAHRGAVAARLAVEAARAGRPAIAVVDSLADPSTRAALDAAHREGLDVVVVVWVPDGVLRDADEHVAMLRDALDAPGVAVLEVPVALDDTRLLVDAAGDVIAWGGIG